MDYMKPQIAQVGPALTTIEGSGKPDDFNQDSNGDFNCTTPAYQADE
jgi:hypothetical protein